MDNKETVQYYIALLKTRKTNESCNTKSGKSATCSQVTEHILKWGAEYQCVSSRKLGGSGHAPPENFLNLSPWMAGNAQEILKMSHFVSVSSSGMGMFVKKIKGMDQVAQKWGAKAPLPARPPAWPLNCRSIFQIIWRRNRLANLPQVSQNWELPILDW